jgi:hypothetical protein
MKCYCQVKQFFAFYKYIYLLVTYFNIKRVTVTVTVTVLSVLDFSTTVAHDTETANSDI